MRERMRREKKKKKDRRKERMNYLGKDNHERHGIEKRGKDKQADRQTDNKVDECCLLVA